MTNCNIKKLRNENLCWYKKIIKISIIAAYKVFGKHRSHYTPYTYIYNVFIYDYWKVLNVFMGICSTKDLNIRRMLSLV